MKYGNARSLRLSNLTIADDYLRKVLEGDAFLVQDGAMGTMLQAAGLSGRRRIADLLCLDDPDSITAIHKAYVDAGAQLVLANTFNSNARKLAGDATVEEVFSAAVSCARASGARYVGADIGPTGEMLEPFGTLSFEDAYQLFAQQARAAMAAGCDVIAIETMSNLLETKAALLAARECTSLPVFVTMTFEEDGRTFLGTSPEIAAATLSALGADAVGINCSLGPKEMTPLVAKFAKYARCPIDVRPNAGLPRIKDGQTVFDLTPEEFAQSLLPLIENGATLIGSCCGSNPDFTKEIADIVKKIDTPAHRSIARVFSVTSAQNLATLEASGSRSIKVIGERINPTGNQKVRDALFDSDYDYLVGIAAQQQEAGADLLDVNVGIPELDEAVMMPSVILRMQAAITLPLCIDSSDVDALENGVRIYAGKPLINSVNGKSESLETVLPIAAKYGCAVIGLTLDESGIPATAHERLEIARRIVQRASELGIPREDIVIDCLTMPASTSPGQPVEIFRAIQMIKEELGVATALGVSNVSFGLPERSLVNASFLASALGAGLDLPIINPNDYRYRDVISVFKVLSGQDISAAKYIQSHSGKSSSEAMPSKDALLPDVPDEDLLRHAVLTGNKTEAAACAKRLLEEMDGISLINDMLIPILDEVGLSFEAGETFLPQLLSSAEAAKAAFDIVRENLPAGPEGKKDGVIVLATVKGDIHDIGKNIVKMLLENYGYRLMDLGKDVSPEAIVETALSKNAKLVGLSALMTTTVQSMKQTIDLLKEKAPDVKIMVGGAVITSEVAEKLGADYYAKDAVESTRIAEEVLK